MADRSGRRTGRRPGDTSNRDVILDAARSQFTQHGFRGATMRAIAAAAGVDPGLIRHFFGDKQGLFSAAMEAPPILDCFTGPREEWGETLARTFLSLWEDPETAAPWRAMAASAFANDEALRRFREHAVAGVLRQGIPLLPPDNPGLRLSLAISHVIGTALARHVIQVPPLAAATLDELVALIGPTVQRYLTGPLPGVSPHD